MNNEIAVRITSLLLTIVILVARATILKSDKCFPLYLLFATLAMFYKEKKK